MTGTIPQTIVVRPEGDKGFGVYCQELRPLATLPNAEMAGQTAVAIAESFHVGVAQVEKTDGQEKKAAAANGTQQSPPPAATATSPRTRVTGVVDKIRELIGKGQDDQQIIKAVMPMYTAAGKKAEDVMPTLKSYVKEVRAAGKKG